MTKHTPEMNISNNFKQPEALRIAIKLEREWTNDALNYDTAQEAWTELRRLYAEVDSLSYRLAYPDNFVKEPEQEPVAIADGTFNHNCPIGTPLYTFPQARESGLIGLHEPSEKWIKEFSHFAELVRTDEREACARVAERSESALHCAAAIRARGDK